MRKIDEHHTSHSSNGNRRIQDGLLDLGLAVGRDHVRNLMCRKGFEAVYRKPRLEATSGSQGRPVPAAVPAITRANQAWATDITYIPMPKGFSYFGGDHGLGIPQDAFLAIVVYAACVNLHRCI